MILKISFNNSTITFEKMFWNYENCLQASHTVYDALYASDDRGIRRLMWDVARPRSFCFRVNLGKIQLSISVPTDAYGNRGAYCGEETPRCIETALFSKGNHFPVDDSGFLKNPEIFGYDDVINRFYGENNIIDAIPLIEDEIRRLQGVLNNHTAPIA